MLKNIIKINFDVLPKFLLCDFNKIILALQSELFVEVRGNGRLFLRATIQIIAALCLLRFTRTALGFYVQKV